MHNVARDIIEEIARNLYVTELADAERVPLLPIKVAFFRKYRKIEFTRGRNGRTSYLFIIYVFSEIRLPV